MAVSAQTILVPGHDREVNGMHSRPSRIVVGIDGSTAALDAASFAAREAVLRDASVHLVRAVIWPVAAPPIGPATYRAIERAECQSAERDLARARRRVRTQARDVEVTVAMDQTSAAELILRSATDASMIVLGSHGRNDVFGLFAGATAVDVASHASIPVAITRGHLDSDGPILVAVDASPEARGALEFAFDEAARRHAAIEAVSSWPPSPDHDREHRWDPAISVHIPARALAGMLAPWAARYPGVPIRRRTARRSRTALLNATRNARLAVIGTPGKLGLGTVGHAMIHRAACPVVVVPLDAAG